jgi:molecular chaperone DnaK
VSAKDLETGLSQSITVTASSGLTEDEIKEMAAESADFLVERRASEEFDGARQEAERIIRELEKMFDEVEKMVMGSEFGQEALAKAREIIKRALKAIDEKDLERLEAEVETLKRTQKMFKGVLGKA